MGRLGQIESIQTPCKILTLGTEIQKSVGATFQSTHYQSRISKKIVLEGISQLSIMVSPTIMLVINSYTINQFDNLKKKYLLLQFNTSVQSPSKGQLRKEFFDLIAKV